MYRFRLEPSLCISCGICVDVCEPEALALRAFRGRTVEGSVLLCDDEARVSGTFPHFASPGICNGCMACVAECPVSAIRIRR